MVPGTLTVSGNTFTRNSAGTDGGGIDNFGTATVSGNTFTRNTAGSGNGGLNNEIGGILTQFDHRFIHDHQPVFLPDSAGTGDNHLGLSVSSSVFIEKRTDTGGFRHRGDSQVGNGVSSGDTNALYFTAGPNNETHGLFGSLRVASAA